MHTGDCLEAKPLAVGLTSIINSHPPLIYQEGSLEELERLLVLLLGCVVQCDNNGPHIKHMQTTMDDVQLETLKGCIQKTTETTDYVSSINVNDLEDIPKP